VLGKIPLVYKKNSTSDTAGAGKRKNKAHSQDLQRHHRGTEREVGDAGGGCGHLVHPPDARPRPVPADRAPPVEAGGASPEHDDAPEADHRRHVEPLRHP
jgi:hypothetical protein